MDMMNIWYYQFANRGLISLSWYIYKNIANLGRCEKWEWEPFKKVKKYLENFETTKRKNLNYIILFVNVCFSVRTFKINELKIYFLDN